MDARNDRDPYQYIPADFRSRAESWLASATNLVSLSDPFLYMAVENLMFAERPILALEARLARKAQSPPPADEPLVLMECAALSIVWVLGLYEVTRILKSADYSKDRAFLDLHENLELVRMPLAKHEARRKSKQPHYPTSTWCPETAKVGWQVFNPATDSMVHHYRTDLADTFLAVTH